MNFGVAGISGYGSEVAVEVCDHRAAQILQRKYGPVSITIINA
jgi:hypothetical protein